MSEPILSYGIKEQQVNENEVLEHLEALSIKGLTVLKNVIDTADLQQYKSVLDVVYNHQIDEIGGRENLKAINDEHIVRLPLAYDNLFLTMALNKTVNDVVSAVLGDYYILMLQNGIINMPSEFNYQASWHRDLNYQHFVSSRPISLSALFCLDDFTEVMGGTFFLPGTHRIEKFPSNEYIINNEITIEAKAGSVLIFDSMTFHRAGHNRSANIRRGINHMYTLPFVKQQISIPKMLGKDFSAKTDVRKFLGYESETGENVTDWRNGKLRKVKS